jgi:hypothetical protein
MTDITFDLDNGDYLEVFLVRARAEGVEESALKEFVQALDQAIAADLIEILADGRHRLTPAGVAFANALTGKA